MRISSRTWWIVFLSLIIGGAAVITWLILIDQQTASRWVTGGFDVMAAVWLGYGLWRWREHPWVGRIGLVVIGSAAAGVAISLFSVFDMTREVRCTQGIWAMSVGFYLALQLLRFLLSGGWAVLGVARTLLDEAVHMRAATVLLVLLFFMLPVLPLLFDPTERVVYQLQSFLTYSLMLVTTLLSLLTIAIAVTTITRELEDRQIFMTMSKPVSRAQYLLGKWLGLALFNVLLVGVSGVGIYTLTLWLADQPAMNEVDRREAQEQVLVARRVMSPVPEDPAQLQNAYERRLTVLREQDPNMYGKPNDPVASVRPQLRAAIQRDVLAGWYALRASTTQAYVFKGLSATRELTPFVQLRIHPKASGTVPDEKLYLAFRYNGRDDTVGQSEMLDGKYHIIQIPTNRIDDQGRLKIEIRNLMRSNGQEQPTITFNTADGMQLLCRVGGFGANLASSMLLLWLRLSFLGMLALAAGTFLSFPVAALLTVLVCVAASGSAYLGESIQEYAAFPKDDVPLWDKLVWVPAKFIEFLSQGQVWDSVKLLIVLIGKGFMELIPSFGEFSGTPLVSQGIEVSSMLIMRAVGWVGVIWTGATALVAWLIFRSRELARVQV